MRTHRPHRHAPTDHATDPANAQATELVAEIVAETNRCREQIRALLDTFPPGEREAARRGLYRDADGRLATRHRLLRAVD
ncbi:hypothetical protein E8D34_13025 [Nocardioides sp. GY 10113]|uniref:hypothetical protein n=1 Tax=Nocardioides sp. GY 10113 TaxID=2569761 RepID=UPI0010A80781|nr:hypothetical protein [Nocardioides sp. GY 10113]TIC85005.1 hypothetical protein E8D34_13025 [Nocardioides sp. GY 10113]